MGMVIKFPGVLRSMRPNGMDRAPGQSATVVILPVVRVERQAGMPFACDTPRTTARPSRRRRRPASRS